MYIVCMVVNSLCTVFTLSCDHLHTGHSVVRVRIALTTSYDHFQHCTSTSLLLPLTLEPYITLYVDELNIKYFFCLFDDFSSDHLYHWAGSKDTKQYSQFCVDRMFLLLKTPLVTFFQNGKGPKNVFYRNYSYIRGWSLGFLNFLENFGDHFVVLETSRNCIYF